MSATQRAVGGAPYDRAAPLPRAADLPHDTIVRRFVARVEATPDAFAVHALATGGAQADQRMTWAEWADAAACVASALVADGVRPGDRVAILAGNVPLWPIADIGALLAGAVVVGVFPTSTAAQAAELLRDCDARIALVDGAAQLAKVAAALDGGARVQRVVCGDAGAAGGDGRATSWAAWTEAGRERLAEAAPEIARRAAALAPDDVAGLIYTSGSTGEPKGACVSHAYVVASAESIAEALGLVAGDSSLSLLPYAHAAERVFGHYTRIAVGMEAGLVVDPTRVWEAARAFRPTLFGGLPRLFEKAHDALVAATGRVDEARAALFGDRLRLATSGGAPLAPEMARTLEAMGLVVLGAYGQTEHLCVAMHRPDDYAFDSVGRLMPGTDARLADDGELLLRRGALTFSGYWGRPDATREAFTDDGAWLRTGDLARFDAHGRLVITGRKKEMLALSTGKKVAPLPIEARLAALGGVAQAVLVGEGRKHVGALLFVRDGASPPDDALVAAHVAQLNASLAPHEQVRRWVVVPRSSPRPPAS